jgi:Kef-type K+ transport system membrane component KefB
VLCLTAINCVAAVVTLTALTSWVHMEQHAGWGTVLAHPLYLLLGSVLMGWAMAALLIAAARLFGKAEEAQFVLLVGVIVLAVACAQALKLSVLLTVLAMGVLARNMDDNRRLLNVEFGYAGQLFFVVLFVVTGAGLVFAEMSTAWWLALAFIATRSAAKSLALLAFGTLSGIGVRRAWLVSLGLTPMTGIAVILVVDTSALYPQFGTPLAATVLTAVALLELVGPLATQVALKLAGEANPDYKDSV